ncbi:HEAT repeat domain-containing protein [candidate division TA06 bacterium]|nr:HEAT repeat domain-containing protein [candidate division TA06 bacterium]
MKKSDIRLWTLDIGLWLIFGLGSTVYGQNFDLSPMDSLFIRASTGEIKYLQLNEPARDTLVQMGEKAVPYLIDQLDTKSARERHTLIAILKKMKEPAVEPLINYIQEDPDRGSSRLAAHILGKIGEEAGVAVPLLIGLIQHQNWRMRMSACEALGEVGDPRAVEPLMTALKDTVFLVRKGAVFGLGKMEDRRSISALIQALGDGSYAVRYPASEALETIGRPAVPPLIKALKENDSITRSLVCGVLGKIQDRRALKPLRRMLKDEDWGVKVAAKEALRSLKSKGRIIESPDSPLGQRLETE